MNAVEFSGKIEGGTIRLPKRYEEYDNSYARVIILIDEAHTYLPAKKKKLKKALQNMRSIRACLNFEKSGSVRKLWVDQNLKVYANSIRAAH